jgi:RHS repeat-associated protein
METGLVYLRQRYYNPEIGRFISRDPYEGEELKPITKHSYQYADNNPVRYTDPTGLFSLGELNAAISMQNILSGLGSAYTAAKAGQWIDRARSIVMMIGFGLMIGGAAGFLLAQLGYGDDLLALLETAATFPGVAVSNDPDRPTGLGGLPINKPVNPLDGSAYLELKLEPPEKSQTAKVVKAYKVEVSVKTAKLAQGKHNWKFKIAVDLQAGGALEGSVGQNDKGQLIFGAAINSDWKFAQVPSVDPKGWIYEGAIRVGASATTTYTDDLTGTTSFRGAIQLKNKLVTLYKLDYNLLTITWYGGTAFSQNKKYTIQ